MALRRRRGQHDLEIRHQELEWRHLRLFPQRRLDANYFQNNRTGQPRPKHNQHQYGGVMGGPIRKDKDFIFGSFEGWIERIGFPTLQACRPNCCATANTSPISASRLLTGQHPRSAGRKQNETAAFCTVNGTRRTFVRDPFPNNVIPSTRLSPIGQKLVATTRNRRPGGAES
jgi:hypothetical protein